MRLAKPFWGLLVNELLIILRPQSSMSMCVSVSRLGSGWSLSVDVSRYVCRSLCGSVCGFVSQAVFGFVFASMSGCGCESVFGPVCVCVYVSKNPTAPHHRVAFSCGAVVCADVPKALLPEGDGRDVYPRVRVNERDVCMASALCVNV